MTTIVHHRDETGVAASFGEFNKLAAENAKLRETLENLCSVVEAEGEHFADDRDGCPICNALVKAHAALK